MNDEVKQEYRTIPFWLHPILAGMPRFAVQTKGKGWKEWMTCGYTDEPPETGTQTAES